MRAAIYARVSSQAQRDRDTIASQLSTLPSFCIQRGWEVVGTYTDDGRSAQTGALEAREGLHRLHRDAAADRFDVVVVVDLDRLTRSDSWLERGAIYGPLQAAGVKIAVSSTGQVLSFDSDEGDLLLGIGNFQSSAWLRKHKERIKRGKLEAIAKGKKPAGPTPFGWNYDRASGTWSLHPERGPLVEEMFHRVAGGESCEQVARDLQARGIERPRAGEWSRERVWQIVTARTAVGVWTADKARKLTVPVPRIVSDELWHAAQARLMEYGLRGLRRTKHVYLCEKIAVCAECGAPIGISSATHVRPTPYYVCSRRRRHNACRLPLHRVDVVDRRVWDTLCHFLTSPDQLELAIAHRGDRAARGQRDWSVDLAGYQRQLERLGRSEAAILERFRRDLVSAEALDQVLERSSRERRLLEQQVATAKERTLDASRARGSAVQLADQVEQLRGRVGATSPVERQELVRALVPGRDGYVVELGMAGAIDLHLVVPVSPALAASSSTKHERYVLEVSLVA